jgi:protein-S-isoprenylcysteine O-methyltransferase Ste14
VLLVVPGIVQATWRSPDARYCEARLFAGSGLINFSLLYGLMFRIATILLFALLASNGFYHRFKAAQAPDKISRKEEGLPIMILLRVFGFSVWLGLLVYMINPNWMAWSSVSLQPGVRWAGAGIVLISIPLIFWMFRSLGTNATDTVVIRKEHSLVTTGPYRYIRHPMYTFSVLTFIGFSLLTANWFIGAAGLIAVVLLRVRTPIEEAMLEEKFGEAYRTYARQTGRFIPKMSR